jgi:hypothetical protein
VSIAVDPESAEASAGHDAVLLRFTNTSNLMCGLDGYPSVAGLDAVGRVIAHASDTLAGALYGCHCTTPPQVTLAAGAWAIAQVEGDTSAGSCPAYTALLVTAPNLSDATKIDASPYSCGFTVHPVIAAAHVAVPILYTPSAYVQAWTQWKQGAAVPAAEQGQYWSTAAADLQEVSETPADITAITELRQLASLPDTGDTATQQVEQRQDVTDLDGFFNTPGLYF